MFAGTVVSASLTSRQEVSMERTKRQNRCISTIIEGAV